MDIIYNNVIEEYNGLEGKNIPVSDLQVLIDKAEKNNVENVYTKLKKLLSDHPNKTGFHFNSVTKLDASEDFAALGIPYLTKAIENDLGTTETEGLGAKISNEDIYKMITNKFIKIIDESGYLPWQTGINNTTEAPFSFADLPMNYQSGKYYNGINALVLSMYRYHTDETRGKVSINNRGEFEEGITEPITDDRLFWLTFKQITEANGKLKKGSLSQQAVYYNFIYTYKGEKITEQRYKQLKKQLGCEKNSSPECANLRRIGFLKYYNVFNERDIENIDFEAKRAELKEKSKSIKTSEKRILAADLVLKHMPNKPKFETLFLDLDKGSSPHYNTNTDTVVMPLKSQFDNVENWYGIAFHELIHATGHEKRTNRRNLKGFERGKKWGDPQYALEELVAEIGAIFLNAESGIMLANLKNNAAYIKDWSKGVKKELQDNHKAIFKAAAQSQKAADYILNRDKNGDPAYWKEFDKISAEIKAKGKAQIAEKEVFVLNKLPKKYEKQIYSNSVRELERLTGFTDKTLSNAAKNMLGLIRNKHFELHNFKHGYLRGEEKQVYMNIPVYVFEKIYKKNITELSKEQLSYILERLEDYQYNTAWNEYGFYGKDVFQVNKILRSNIAAIKRFFNPQPPNKTKKVTKKQPEPKQDEKGQLALFGLNGTAKTKESIAFNKAILTAKNNFSKAPFMISLGKTKGILENHIGKVTLVISKDVIKKAMQKNEDHVAQWHDFINLPDYINDPLAIFKSKSNGFIVLTEIKNYKDKPLMVALHVNSDFKVSKLASIYARSNTGIYKKWVDEGLAVYINKKCDWLNFSSTPIAVGSSQSQSKSTTKSGHNKNRSAIKYDKAAMEQLKTDHNVSFDFIRKSINGIRKSTTALLIKKEYNELVNGSKNGLNGSNEPEIVKEVSQAPTQAIEVKKTEPVANPLVSKINHEYMVNKFFEIGGDIGEFLGKIEIKPVGSVACTIDAEQGAGKTRFTFQIANELAKKYKVLFISLEEHPQSDLFQSKVKQYIEPQNTNNIDVVGDLERGKEKQLLDSLIPNYDVIIIDSWNKIYESSKLDFDNDLRKAYNGKLIFAIFQRTVTGGMRGGTKAGFDGDIIMKGIKGDDFKENVIIHNKNRYQSKDLTKLRYNVYYQELEKTEAENEPIKQDEAPVKNDFFEWEDAIITVD